MTDVKRVLVTGATGNIGTHLVRHLMSQGVTVRAAVRDVSRLPSGVEAVPVDLMRPETLEPTLRDVDAAFLLWPGYDAEGSDPIVDLLAAHVEKIVFQSAIRPNDLEGGFWGHIENRIEKTGVAWTFVQAAGFMSNIRVWDNQIKDGLVLWPYPTSARPLISEFDIAAVAAVSLLNSGHEGKRYELTGPQPMTLEEHLAIVGDVLGQPIRVEESSVEDARVRMREAWDVPFVEGTLAVWEYCTRAPEPLLTTAQDVTKAAPKLFVDWVGENRQLFA